MQGDSQRFEDMETREISTTKRWAIGIIIIIVVQTAAFIWAAALAFAQVEQNKTDIGTLKNSASVILSRENVEDILSGRDEKIEALKDELSDFKLEVRGALLRIENKL